MTAALRIAIADDEPSMRDYLCETLQVLGHEVVAVAETGRELLERCRAVRPQLVITDITMPDVDGLDAAAAIYVTESIPVIIVSAYHDPELLERAQRNQILAYLVKPIKLADLEAAIAIAVRRPEELQALHSEADGLREALQDRTVIERAKGILMKLAGISEPEAALRLRLLASQQRTRLVELAQTIIREQELHDGRRDGLN
jgi:response regulator NasT